MTTIDPAASTGTGRSGQMPADGSGESILARLGLAFTNWAERWFPDAYVFVALAVVVVAAAALLNGASPPSVAKAFGEGFWSLITFTMQMAFVIISGYVVATSPPAAKLIDALAAWPRNARAAVGFVAAVSMLTSLLNWGMSLIFSGLLVRALARRTDLRMDYRAAGAAGCLGLGATWALGLSSSAAQLQANAASLPKPLLEITGVIPFSQTIFLWQSLDDRRGPVRPLDHARAAVVALGRQGGDGADDGREPRNRAGTAAAAPTARRMARIQSAPHPDRGGAGGRLAGAGIRHQGSDPGDLQSQHLQPHVPDARRAACIGGRAASSMRSPRRSRPPPAS